MDLELQRVNSMLETYLLGERGQRDPNDCDFDFAYVSVGGFLVYIPAEGRGKSVRYRLVRDN